MLKKLKFCSIFLKFFRSKISIRFFSRIFATFYTIFLSLFLRVQAALPPVHVLGREGVGLILAAPRKSLASQYTCIRILMYFAYAFIKKLSFVVVLLKSWSGFDCANNGTSLTARGERDPKPHNGSHCIINAPHLVAQMVMQ